MKSWYKYNIKKCHLQSNCRITCIKMIDIKKIVFKDLDGKTQSTNFIKSINNKEVPESGDVVLNTIEHLSVQGSKMKITKSNGASDILELPAGGVKTVEGIEPDENGNIQLGFEFSTEDDINGIF